MPRRFADGFACQPPTLANRDIQHPDDLQYSVPPFAFSGGQGILTLFPSVTLLSLTLGADSPCSDERRAGNLGLTASGLFTRFNVTHVSIRTSDTSSNPYESPSQAYRTLPYPTTHQRRCRSFGAWFSPVTSSAQADSTSELLRFL